jgi:hypothetical protein
MDLDLSHGYAEVCLCGRSFSESGPLKRHQRTCHKSNKRLSGALAMAKELWVERKRRRIESLAASGSGQLPELEGTVDGFNPAEVVRTFLSLCRFQSY